MSRRTPLVTSGALFDPATPLPPIRLDTPAWLAWLEQPTTTRFAYPLFDPAHGYIVGRMTVRKEQRQRGGSYWTVYRRAGRQVRKVYLGTSACVTHARLEAIATALRTAADGSLDDGLTAGKPIP
jgi:hypothetical protein